MSENTSKDGLSLTIQENSESSIKETPIRKVIWKELPKDSEKAIRDRWAEFLESDVVSDEVKALGVLTTELLVKSSKELGKASFNTALYNNLIFSGEPTLYGASLYKDRIVLAVTPINNYGLIQIMSLPLDKLNEITGNVAAGLAQERPNVSRTLLSPNSTEHDKCEAKVSMMRYLLKAKTGSVKILSEMGGMYPNIGLGYTIDGVNPIAKLYISEIPDTDPLLGEAMEFYTNSELYKNITAKLDDEIFEKMTTQQIENYIKNLPLWAQNVLMGRGHHNAGFKSWRIFEVLEKLGYKGNEAQKAYRKHSNLSTGFLRFSNEFRGKILHAFMNGDSYDEDVLTPDSIDLMFKEAFERYGDKKLPKGFSITKAVSQKTPLKDLDI